MAPFVALLSSLLVTVLAMRSTQQKESLGEEQLAEIWSEVEADEGEAAPMPSALGPLRLMSTFSWRKDQPLPPGHQKLIHPVGSVAKIHLEWDHAMMSSLGFTGVFAKDQEQALIRIGPAGALKKTGMAPGVSVKVFRDFKESVNTLMLYSLRGSPSDESAPMCAPLRAVRKASAYPFTTGLSQWAEQDHTSPKFPFVICFRPMDHEQLQHLSAGKKIYEIYVGAGPRTQLKPVGHVSLVSELGGGAGFWGGRLFGGCGA
eukprot:g2050.t1